MHLTEKEFQMKPLSDANLPGIVMRAGFFRPDLVESTGLSLLFRHSQGCSGGHSLTWDWLSDKMEALSLTTIRNLVVVIVVVERSVLVVFSVVVLVVVKAVVDISLLLPQTISPDV